MVTGAGYKLEIDLTGVGTTFVELDVVAVDEALNETIDTFYKLNGGGYATNRVTALDPQYTLTIKGDSTDTLITGIAEKRYSVGTGRDFAYKITDNLTAEVITGDATFTAISSPKEVATVTTLTVVFKFVGAPSIA